MSIDSAPPIVANADAQAALLQVASVPEGQPMVRVVRAWKLLQVAGAMFDAGTITEEEYGKFHVFYFRCTAMAAGFPAVPASSSAGSGGREPPGWFRPAMEEVLRPLMEAIQPKIDIETMNSKARIINSRATKGSDVLEPIFCGVKRERYSDFPTHLGEIDRMDDYERLKFLQFYGYDLSIDDSTMGQQLRKIKKFIGIHI